MKKLRNKKVRAQIILTPNLILQLDYIALKKETSRSALIREASYAYIKDYFEKINIEKYGQPDNSVTQIGF
jgi:metal-responsive CopG/Arc/MetJ family transcriptional regulator